MCKCQPFANSGCRLVALVKLYTAVSNFPRVQVTLILCRYYRWRNINCGVEKMRIYDSFYSNLENRFLYYICCTCLQGRNLFAKSQVSRCNTFRDFIMNQWYFTFITRLHEKSVICFKSFVCILHADGLFDVLIISELLDMNCNYLLVRKGRELLRDWTNQQLWRDCVINYSGVTEAHLLYTVHITDCFYAACIAGIVISFIIVYWWKNTYA